MASSHGLLILSEIFLNHWLASWRNNCPTEPQTRFEAWEDWKPLLSSRLLIFIWLAFLRWFLFILSCQWAAWLRDQSASHLTHLSRLPCLPGGFLCPFMSFHSSFSLFLGIKSVFLILTHSFIGSHEGRASYMEVFTFSFFLSVGPQAMKCWIGKNAVFRRHVTQVVSSLVLVLWNFISWASTGYIFLGNFGLPNIDH